MPIQQQFPTNPQPDELQLLYRLMVAQAPYAVFLHHNNHFLFANPAAIRLFGAEDEQDLRSHSFMDFIPQKAHSKVLQTVHRLQRETNLVFPLELQFETLDNRVIDVEMTASSIVWKDEVRMHGMLRDVSEKRREEQSEAFRYEWTVFRKLTGHLADLTLNSLAVIAGYLTLLKEGDWDINLDVLLEETTTVHQLWQTLIQVSQDHMVPEGMSPMDMLAQRTSPA